jgi:NAD kinase
MNKYHRGQIYISMRMFSKVFITWKKDYGESIVLRVCELLRQLGIAYAFDEPQDCDLAIMVGGDGTLLKHQASLECPIFGINPGKSVGFYTSADSGDFERKLRKLLTGGEGKAYFVRDFTRLEASINKTPLPFLSLNEVLVSPVYVRRIFESSLSVKSRRSEERNSGILVYTASGSHAYAKSAGAKTFEERGKFGVVAIAPYSGRLKRGEITLTKGQITVKCLNNEGEVCIDGQEEQVCRLKKGDIVTVRKSPKPAKIIFFSKPARG